MPNRAVSKIRLFFRQNLRRLEALFFMLKGILSERHFIYLSCVVVAISTAFAVIALKYFAHNVYLLPHRTRAAVYGLFVTICSSVQN